MTDKTYGVVGVSRVRKGAALKLRVANGKPARRARILERNGHADIELFEVNPAVSKEAAAVWLQDNHADLFALLTPKKAKAQKAEGETKVEKTTTKAAPKTATKAPAKTASAEDTAELSPEAKLALRRARDAARKREKRAAAKAAAA